MDNRKKLGKRLKNLLKSRNTIQAFATFLTNVHLPNFLKGVLYNGKVKQVCVPGLNCYSCPAATGACPLGAFYSLFNRFSLLRYKVDEDKCIACGKCSRVCKMDVDISKNTAHTECIRCGKCIKACPTKAILIHWGMEKPIKIKENEKSTKIGDKKNELV